MCSIAGTAMGLRNLANGLKLPYWKGGGIETLDLTAMMKALCQEEAFCHQSCCTKLLSLLGA